MFDVEKTLLLARTILKLGYAKEAKKLYENLLSIQPNHNLAKNTKSWQHKNGTKYQSTVFSRFDEGNKKVRNFNENINLPISHDISHFFMILWELEKSSRLI